MARAFGIEEAGVWCRCTQRNGIGLRRSIVEVVSN